MHIDKKIVEKFMGPLGQEEVNVSLFIVSSKDARLKRLALDPNLSPEERARKLHKYAQEHRYVAVIATGQEVFAHANAAYAEQLQAVRNLAIDGKKVTVKALSDEESEQLSAVGEAFEDYVLDQVQEKENVQENPDLMPVQLEIRQFFAKQSLISDAMHIDLIIASLENIPSRVIVQCLRQMSEARREAEKERKENEKRTEILERVIKKDILQREVKASEIKAQVEKQNKVQQDSERLDFTRGE